MKILFSVRPDFSYTKGITGDFIQVFETKKALNKLGINVTVSTDFEFKGNWDVIHLWNSSDWYVGYTYLRFINIKYRYKTVLSTIYWPWDLPQNQEYLKKKGGIIIDKVSEVTGNFIAGYIDGIYEKYIHGTQIQPKYKARYYCNIKKLGFDETRKRVYEMAGLLLPNSKSEAKIITERYGHRDKIRIVPNAVDFDFFYNADSSWFTSKYGIKDFILCVGAISPWKNQLSLLQALKDTDDIVVLIGGGTPDYINKCAEVKRKGRTIILPPMSREQVASAFKSAKVHVLPSYRETPGLVSLEAAAAGCAIVSTDRGSAKDYFGDLAYYCNPDNLKSIFEAVYLAKAKGPSSELCVKIQTNYSWDKAAEATLKAYNECIYGQ